MTTHRDPTSTVASQALRRSPMQRRSAERVQRMLDAAQELVAEIGYEALSTTLIAERAGVSIGSLYQFFPDKQAVVRAIALRNLERYEERIARLVETLEFTNWWDVVSAVIDEYAAMHHEIPGFSVIRFGDVADLYLVEPARDNDALVAEWMADLLIGLNVVAADSAPQQPLLIAIKIGDTLTRLAFQRDPRGDPWVLDETKHVVRNYLSHHLGEAVGR